jgi:hypothetical protein
MPVKYQVVPNPLTTPPSFYGRTQAIEVLGSDRIAELVNLHNPTIPYQTAATVIEAFRDEIVRQLALGNTVKIENFVSFVTTLPVALETPESPLPANALDIKAKPSAPFKSDIRRQATLERQPFIVKAPNVASAYDASIGHQGLVREGFGLRIGGSDLAFDQTKSDEGVFLESANETVVRQVNIALNEPSNLIIIPEFDAVAGPAGAASVEHMMTVRTRYTETGNVRIGSYSRPLRTINPISDANVKLFVVEDNANGPAIVKAYTGDKVLARIIAQVTPLNVLTLSIAPMDGETGQAMNVTANGDYVLSGLNDDVTVTVSDFAALTASAKSRYGRYFQEFIEIEALTP